LIDGLRGIAALAVVIFHYHHFYLIDYTDRPNMPPFSAQPFGSILFPIYEYGHHAVELFWVISGFVFAHVYLNRPTSFWDFSVARFARLYPLHLATLLLVAALQLASLSWAGHWQIYGNNDLRHFILHLGFASNWSWYNQGLSYNGPIWSVSLEIIAYALFLVALPLLRRFGLAVAIGLMAVAWVVSVQDHLPIFRPLVFACAGYFFLGCSIYCLLRLAGPKTWGAVPIAALAAGAGAIWGAEVVVIAAVSTCLILALALLEGRVDLGPWVQRLGDMSYSIYLVHVPLQMAVLFLADIAFGGSRAFAAYPVTLLIYLGITIVVADVAYRRFEKPVGRVLRHRLSHAKPQA
jgi:peptidoglycan/LPS O-acetylase OafA/YrhL